MNLINKNETPNDFYTFLLHRLISNIEHKLEKGVEASVGSYQRLATFFWERKLINKIIMTFPYGASPRSMKESLKSQLTVVEYDEINKCYWFIDGVNSDVRINTQDISLLIYEFNNIFENDYIKIENLVKYFKNVAKLFNFLNLEIKWSTPSGIQVYQSYLKAKVTSISPFSYSKSKINLKIPLKGQYDYNKQMRSFMANMVHSLDAASLTLLYFKFNLEYKDLTNFYSIHDYFSTTVDKTDRLKNLLVYVYIGFYFDETFMLKFDEEIRNYI